MTFLTDVGVQFVRFSDMFLCVYVQAVYDISSMFVYNQMQYFNISDRTAIHCISNCRCMISILLTVPCT